MRFAASLTLIALGAASIFSAGCGRLGYAVLPVDASVPRDLSTFDAQLPSDAGAPTDASADSFVSEDAGTDWWDSTWRRRIAITVVGPERAEDLLDFPVLVVLTPARFTRAALRSDTGDLRFIDADGVTVLDHDLEKSTSSDDLFLWVRLPRIPGSRHRFWLYYANPSAAALGREASVWSATYIGVWHLDRPLDSTANRNHGSGIGLVQTTGKIGDAFAFDGAGAYMRIEDSASLHRMSSAATISAWGRRRVAQPVWRALVAREHSGGQNAFWAGFYDDAYSASFTASTYVDFRAGAAPLGDFTHVTSVYDGTSLRLYADGAFVDSRTLRGVTDDAGYAVVIGADAVGATIGSDFFDGVIDEVRLEAVARSAQWIASDSASMNDALLMYGLDESR